MKKEEKRINYTNAPKKIKESLNRAILIPNFTPVPEQVKEMSAKKVKKPINIYLRVETIEKFKKAAEQNGTRYQTMISDVLDTYTQQYLK